MIRLTMEEQHMFDELRIRTNHVRKALAVVVLTATGAVAQGLIVGAAAAWVMLVVGALTTAGVYGATNTDRDDRGAVNWVAVAAVLVALVALVWLVQNVDVAV